jgi:cyanophycinase-like exopeptidase
MSYTNINEAKKGQIIAMTDVKFHLLPSGYKFHIESRVPGKSEELVTEAPPEPIELKAKVKKARAALKKASS